MERIGVVSTAALRCVGASHRVIHLELGTKTARNAIFTLVPYVKAKHGAGEDPGKPAWLTPAHVMGASRMRASKLFSPRDYAPARGRTSRQNISSNGEALV